ncbi:Phage-associated homing endonuclease [Salinisphaera sp. LB1]|nr:Phage-associated homing endonuclease [Salinisphaera sp. LB1]
MIYAMYHGDIEPWMVVQHINADDTDDSINNLRLVTRTLARRRRRQYSNNTSGFIGVSWHKMSRKWYAYVFVDKKLINLGTYHDPREAARVHDRAKVQAYGIEHAWTNARAGLLDDERKAA